MRIALTDTHGSEQKFSNYLRWLEGGPGNPDCIVISWDRDNLSVLEECDGVVLTGGHDVDPRLYGGRTDHPKLQQVDQKRDTFERKVLDHAVGHGLPLLGICRGLQIANVHLGGTLIQDLPEITKEIHGGNPSGDPEHRIDVVKDSALADVAGSMEGIVNTSHHQAALEPGKGLKVSARASDGVIEALETDGSEDFFLLVRWHPERMQNTGSPFSRNILTRFLKAAAHRAPAHTGSKE
jgi:putative glutamine amidotransferase